MSYGQNEFLPELEEEYEYELNENELAQEVLELQTEGELNQFLGNLVSNVWKRAKALYNSPLGQAVKQQTVSGLKSFGRQMLPSLGRTVFSHLGGGLGDRLGQYAAGRFLGEEFEGAAPEDRAFETARRLVLTARLAAKNISKYYRENGSITQKMIRSLIIKAARHYFPDLPIHRVGSGKVRPIGRKPQSPTGSSAKTQGQWYRQGRCIIVKLT